MCDLQESLLWMLISPMNTNLMLAHSLLRLKSYQPMIVYAQMLLKNV